MRQYVIDEIPAKDMESISEYLKAAALESSIPGLFWIDVPEDLLTTVQYEHQNCKPFCFSVELGEDFIKFELLVRSRQTLRCNCNGYANRAQRDFIFNFADKMLSEKQIRT